MIPSAAIDNDAEACFSFYPVSQSRALRIGALAAIGILILVLLKAGRLLIPPGPLRLASAEFGRDFEKTSLDLVSPLTQVEPASSSAPRLSTTSSWTRRRV